MAGARGSYRDFAGFDAGLLIRIWATSLWPGLTTQWQVSDPTSEPLAPTRVPSKASVGVAKTYPNLRLTQYKVGTGADLGVTKKGLG